MNMKNKSDNNGSAQPERPLQRAIRLFKQCHPQTKEWGDTEIVEAMMLILSEEKDPIINVASRRSDGRVIFRSSIYVPPEQDEPSE